MCGRNRPKYCIHGKYFMFTRVIKNLGVGTYRNFGLMTIGADNLLYEWPRITHPTESVEVVEQLARIIHDKMDLGDCLVMGSNVVIAANDIVGKDAGKVIPLLSPARITRPLPCDTLDQRYPRQVVQDTRNTLVRYSKRVKILAVSEIEGSILSCKRKFTVELFPR